MANLVASRLNSTDFSAYLRTLTIFDETGDNVAIKFRCSVIRADDAQNTAVFFETAPFVEYALDALNISADTADKRLAAEGSSVAQFTTRAFVEAHDLLHFLQVVSSKKDGTVFKSKAAALAELSEIITDELETSTEFLRSVNEPEWFSYLTRAQFESLTGTKAAPVENTKEQAEQAAVDPEAELVASLEATLAAQEAAEQTVNAAIAEQDAFEAAHADEMVLEPAADVDGDDWADDFVDDDDSIEDMDELDEYAALSSDAVCMAKGAAESAKLVSGAAGSTADATCFAAQFVAGMVQDAQVAINDANASVLDVMALMLDRVHLASFMGEFTRAHSMIWLYREHLYSLTKSCGVYDEALVKIHAALEAAGLRGFLATEIEEVLTDRLASRITEALEELNQVTNPAMMPAALERVNARVGALLSQGFGPDMGPATDPDNLRRRYAYREDAWRDPKAQVLAAIRRDTTAAQATAPAEVAQAPAENAPAAAQSVPTMAAQTEAAGVDLSRYSDDVDAYLNLLTPQRPEPEQGSLVFPEVGDKAGDEAATMGAQAGAAAPCAEVSAIDWDEVEASDGFVYDPEEGAQFFTLESDAGVSTDCARAQGTIERDGGVKTYEHPTQDDDATSALLEGVLRTDDEMADLAGKVTGAAAPTSGKAACAAKVAKISAGAESTKPSHFDTHVEFVGFNSKAKGNQTPDEFASSFPVVAERIEIDTCACRYYADSAYKCAAPGHTPNLSPEVLQLTSQNGLFPAPCDAQTDVATLSLAWQALTWRAPIKLTYDQEELVRNTFERAKEFLAEVIFDLDFWDVPQDSFNQYNWDIKPYKASLLLAIERIEEMTPEFTELRGALLEPMVQTFMCRMAIYQQAAGRGAWTGDGSSPYLRNLSLVPTLSKPIAQTLNTSQSTYLAGNFVKECESEFLHSLKYAYPKSAGFYIAPKLRREYSDIAAARLTPLLFWPFTASFGVKTPYWCALWEAFADYNPYLMRCANVIDHGTHLDMCDVIAARSCEDAVQLLHDLAPTEDGLSLFGVSELKKRISAALKADFFGKEDISGEISSLFSANQVLSSTAEHNLKTWRPNECYNGDYTREDLLLDTCLNGLSDTSKAACTQIGAMVDEFVADAKSSKLIVWDKRAELEIKAAALWDKIHEAYPDLAQLRKQELHGLFWSELQQLMAGGWVKIEPAQIPKVLDYLVGFYENGFMRDVFWEALSLAILRRYAPKDKEHNLRDKDREQGQLRIDGFKQALSWGYHQHSVAFELLFYTPREVLASYFHGWSWFDHNSIEHDFEFTLRWVWSRAQDVVLGQEPHEKNPKGRRKPGMEG